MTSGSICIKVGQTGEFRGDKQVKSVGGFLIVIFCAVFATGVAAQSEFRVNAGDTLTIEVSEDPALNRSVIVLSDGRVNFPLAGNIRVAGRTVSQIEDLIEAAIAPNFTVDPNVFVSVQPKERVAAAPRPPAPDPTIGIYFLGEVSSPGLKELKPGTDFLQALAQSGGLTRFAADKRIQIRRTDPRNGTQQTFVVNYRAILDGAAIQQNFALRDGDVVVVPERRLFE